MKKGKVLWRKRMALLLAAALLTGETGAFASTANAAELPQTSVASEQVAETLPVPDDYITLGDDAAPQPEQLDAAQTQEVPEGVQEVIPVLEPVSEDGEDAPASAGDGIPEGAFIPEEATGEENAQQFFDEPVTGDMQGNVLEQLDVAGDSNAPDPGVINTASAITLDTEYTVSDNGIINISYTPEEAGYYALVLYDANLYSGEFYIIHDNTLESGITMSCSTPYINKMEQGQQYGIYVNLFGQNAKYKVVKTTVVDIDADTFDEKQTEIHPTEIMVVMVSPQQDGLLRYSYYDENQQTFYPLTWISGKSGILYGANGSGFSPLFGNQSCMLVTKWDSTVPEVITLKTRIMPYHTYNTDLLGTSEKVAVYYGNRNDNSSYVYRDMLANVSFTPTEDGTYYFAIGSSASGSCTLYEIGTDGQWNYAQNLLYGAAFVVGELQAGKQYVCSMQGTIFGNESAPSQTDASVVRVTDQPVTLNSEETVNLKAGQILSFPAGKGRFYKVTLQNGHTDDRYAIDMIGGRIAAPFRWSYHDFDTEANVFYMFSDDSKLMICKDISNGVDGTIKVKVEECDIPVLTAGVTQANAQSLLPAESYVTSFTPSESGSYNFWGISYTSITQYATLYTVNNYGQFERVSKIGEETNYAVDDFFTDSFDDLYELTAGQTYYLCVYHNYGTVGMEDDLVCVEKAQGGYDYDFGTDKEKSVELDMYKAARLRLKVPEAGFYEIETNGTAPNYYVKDSKGNSCTVYNGQPKQLYLDGQGDYVLNLAREFKKDDAADHVTVTIRKCESLAKIPLCKSETDDGISVVLRDSQDYCYFSFTADEAGYYDVFSRAEFENVTYENGAIRFAYYRKKDNASLQYESDNSIYGLKLEKGETIYVKVSTYFAYLGVADVNLKMGRYVEDDVAVGEKKKVEHNGCARLRIEIPESGAYRVAVSEETGSSLDYGLYADGSGYRYSIAGSNYYLQKGTYYLRASTSRMQSGSFQIEVAKQEVQPIETEILADKLDKGVWIRYTADVTETKCLTVTNPNFSAYMYLNTPLLYELASGNEEIYHVSGYDAGGDGERGAYLIADFEQGRTYFICLSGYNYDGIEEDSTSKQPIRLSLGTVATASASLDEEAELTISKAGRVGLDRNDYDRGWYKVSVDGDASNLFVRFNGENAVVQTPGDYYFRQYQKGNISLTLINKGSEEALALGVTVTKFEPSDATKLGLREKVNKTAESNMECYSFTAPEKGTYQLNTKGISYVRAAVNNKKADGNERWWYDKGKLALNKDDVVFLYIINQKGKDFSLSIGQVQKKFFFDYDEYTAFIASGGSITLQKYADLPDEYWNNENDTWYWYDSENVIYASTKDFKNPNDTWPLVPKYSANFSTLRTTYGDYDNDKFRPRYVYEGQVFEGLYKSAYTAEENRIRAGSLTKAAAADPVEGPIIAVKTRPEYVLVQEITITGVNALNVGTSIALRANLDTKNQYLPTNPAVEWKSSDSNIVAVDQNGTITARSAGKATITVTSKDQLHKSAQLVVTAVPVPGDSQESQGSAGSMTPSVVYVQNVIISGDSQLYVGDTTRLTATLDTGGQGAPSRDGVTWKTSDANIATVDADGTVTAVSAGVVTITAESNDGMAKADYAITVSNIVEKKIILNESAIRVKKGTSYKWLKVTFTPENTTIKTLKWTTGNKKIATVNNKGVITAKGIGKTTVTVTSAGGKKAAVNVTVTKDDIKTTKLSLPSRQKLYVGDSLTLVPEFTPVNATNQKVKWKSSDEQVAVISAKGVVTALKAGKATITVTSQDGSKKTAKCVITVSGLSKPEGLKVSSKKKKTAELSWKEVKDADGYNIYMSTSKKGTYKKVGSTKAGVTTYTQKKLTSKKKIYFKVAAYRKAGKKNYEGTFSAIKAVKVK